MTRKILNEEEKQRKLMIREFLKDGKIKTPEDLNNLFKNMVKDLIEEYYQGEIEVELGYTKYDCHNKNIDNSRNEYSSKTLKTSKGEIDVSIPRDRNGDCAPQLIKKHKNTIGQDLEAKIISMYAKGMSTNGIQALYGFELSDNAISRIADKILPIAKEWQNRPLDPVYAVVFLDAIHYHVRSEGQIVKETVYIVIGIS